MKLIPTQYYILVRMRHVEQSSIVAPDGASPTAHMPYGEVLAIGPKVEKTKVGDFVLFNPNGITGFEHKSLKDQFIVAEGAIFAHLDLENVVPMV